MTREQKVQLEGINLTINALPLSGPRAYVEAKRERLRRFGWEVAVMKEVEMQGHPVLVVDMGGKAWVLSSRTAEVLPMFAEKVYEDAA